MGSPWGILARKLWILFLLGILELQPEFPALLPNQASLDQGGWVGYFPRSDYFVESRCCARWREKLRRLDYGRVGEVLGSPAQLLLAHCCHHPAVLVLEKVEVWGWWRCVVSQHPPRAKICQKDAQVCCGPAYGLADYGESALVAGHHSTVEVLAVYVGRRFDLPWFSSPPPVTQVGMVCV